MRKTKRFTALMMAALVAFGLVGCGGSTASTQPAGETVQLQPAVKTPKLEVQAVHQHMWMQMAKLW